LAPEDRVGCVAGARTRHSDSNLSAPGGGWKSVKQGSDTFSTTNGVRLSMLTVLGLSFPLALIPLSWRLAATG